MNAALPDQVRYIDEGVERCVSVDEFLQIPLRLRVQMILSGSVLFFVSGAVMDSRVALAALAKHARPQ